MPALYRYTAPVRKKAATGPVAAVYAQMSADFLLGDGPLMALSPAPDLLTAAWALLREAQVAGDASRAGRELVAAVVSSGNECPFCVDAHTLLVHATGAHASAETVRSGGTPADPGHAALVAWATGTATAATAATAATGSAAPPFPAAEAPEYLGTVLVTHFINRMVSSLLTEELLPGGLQGSALVRRVAGRVAGGNARRRSRPGESLPLLAGLPAAPPPSWAGDSPVGPAFAALRAVAATGGDLLTDPARTAVLDTVARWDGGPQPMASGWLDAPLAALPAADRPAARLALLAALAPYRVTDADIAAWRTPHHRPDAELVRLLAFGAMAAVERVATWVGVRQPTP
ncbi:DNA-binding protein [Streptomyces sp. NPDC092296]|uniref:DNA-binding protein n=1 Tax=Streptomyces sp. NPDC092296 TaxID=3366012 RepID=UPI00381A17F9